MSTLTYTNSDYDPRAAASASPHKPVWRRAYDAVMQSQQRRAEREIAAYLSRHGGLLTDDMEREIMLHLEGRRRGTL
ncbi:MAG TPA: hypothetical protein VFR00_00980 [Hyphomicrobiaceae bacterium]|jgi:hypothetical protein|nr:hypothetical protein [Hyphomicrobiaceae bacterium]